MSEIEIKDSFLKKHPQALVGKYGRVRGGWVYRPMNFCRVKILELTERGEYLIEFPFPSPFSGKRTMRVPLSEICIITNEEVINKHRQKAMTIRTLREEYSKAQGRIRVAEEEKQEILQRVCKLK